MKRHEEAMMAYMEGLDHDPTNQQLKDAIKECKSHLSGMSDYLGLALSLSHLLTKYDQFHFNG
jgi:hypothetical protein